MAQPQDPSPSEIAERCLLIQAIWTPDERMKRLRVDLRPMVRTGDGRLLDVTVDDYDGHHVRDGCD